MTKIRDRIRVVDIDSHLLEPPDLWTNRLAHKRDHHDLPHVRFNPDADEDWWYVGEPARSRRGQLVHRQVHACFWFERLTPSRVLDIIGVDNVMYETDFPNPTSMSPGLTSIATPANEFIEDDFSSWPEDQLSKVLHDNAARVYHLD